MLHPPPPPPSPKPDPVLYMPTKTRGELLTRGSAWIWRGRLARQVYVETPEESGSWGTGLHTCLSPSCITPHKLTVEYTSG